ncbi:M28 family peptidase [Krasilnikovia cinnamomea]|nr:M28 family peptidase [Krasilnikovia cinnamomea]
MRLPPERSLVHPGHRVLAGFAAAAALVAVGAAVVLGLRPPGPRPADADPGAFSAGRASGLVRAIAVEPHVAGSAANDRVLTRLVDTLRGLGLAPQVQDAVSVQGGEPEADAGGVGVARVRNVVTLLPGTAPTGRIYLVAHYDSIQTGPGGNDDAAGVATVLETARALLAGPRPRNDVVLVLTDAEEACLCGARAFVDQHPLARGGGVALNLEARGSTGPVIMFETSADNARLVAAYARAPHPVGTSFAVEIYRLLPNDTDFTAFREAGFAGLNSAYIDGAAVYHAPTDVPATVDTASLQQHGDNALALARDLGDRDLGGLRAGGDATYFPAFGALVTYPGWLTRPLAVLAALAPGALGWLVGRRGLASGRALAAGAALAPLPLLLAPVLAQLFWSALTLIRPGYAALPIDPYRPLWFRLAVLALTATVTLAWYASLRRRVGPAALAVGGFGWLAALGLVLAAVAPGGAYLTALPALAGAVAGLAAILLRPAWAAVAALVAGAAVAVVVLLPAVILLFPALGLVTSGVAAFMAALLGLALLPILDLLHPPVPPPAEATPRGTARERVAGIFRRRAALPALVAAVATLACAAAGLAVDRFDAAHPAPTHLMYALDADTGQARWLSRESAPRGWTGRHVSGDPATVADNLPGLGSVRLLSGPAPAADLPAPRLTVMSDTRAGDTRTLRVRLVPQRPVRLVTLHVGSATEVTAATIAGRALPVDHPAEGRWGFGLVFHAPPRTGIEATLTVRATGPVTLRVMDGSDGLTGLPGFHPRPGDVGVVGSHTSELVAVARTVTV